MEGKVGLRCRDEHHLLSLWDIQWVAPPSGCFQERGCSSLRLWAGHKCTVWPWLLGAVALGVREEDEGPTTYSRGGPGDAAAIPVGSME